MGVCVSMLGVRTICRAVTTAAGDAALAFAFLAPGFAFALLQAVFLVGFFLAVLPPPPLTFLAGAAPLAPFAPLPDPLAGLPFFLAAAFFFGAAFLVFAGTHRAAMT